MTNVKIGLEDEQLLAWFNEFHAALLEADKQIKLAGEAKDKAKGKAIKRALFKRLIAAVEAISHRIRNVYILS